MWERVHLVGFHYKNLRKPFGRQVQLHAFLVLASLTRMCALSFSFTLYTERDADTNGTYEMVVRVGLGVMVKKETSALTGNRTVIEQPAGRNIWFSCGEVSLKSHSKNLCVIILHFLNIRIFLKKNPWKPSTSKVPRFSDFSLRGHGFDSKPVFVGFVLDKVARGLSIRVVRFSPVSRNPPLRRTDITFTTTGATHTSQLTALLIKTPVSLPLTLTPPTPKQNTHTTFGFCLCSPCKVKS